MTTEQLRKVIKVTHWMIGEKGLSISYEPEDVKPTSRHLVLNPQSAIRELGAVGSVDDYICDDDINRTSIEFDDKWHSFPQFLERYQFCQWEALCIVLRHEAEQELNNDINMLELDSALNALK